MARMISRKGPPKIAIADDSGLIYSDDYRHGWKRGFESLGIETKVFDISPLRRLGHRGPYRSTTMPGTAKDLARNIVGWGASLVFCHHGRAASNGDFLSVLKRNGIPTVVYLCDEPYEVGETAKYSPAFDFVFTMDPCTIDAHRFSRAGRERKVFYLPACADPSHFRRRPYFDDDGKLIRKTPAFFLGNADLIPRRQWLEPIDRLVDGADIRFFPHRNKGRPVAKGHPQWVGLGQHPQLYSDCVVGLNVHRHPGITKECYATRVRNRKAAVPKGLKLCEAAPRQEGTGFWNDADLPAAHVNPRFFEMASCGTLVVSDSHRRELRRMFPMAPQADDPDHFYELVDHYLRNPREAEEIGHLCSTLISNRHTYQHRAAEVLIRVGFRGWLKAGRCSYLAERQDWLTPQDSELLGIRSLSGPTGPSERWSPAYGTLWTRGSGDPSVLDSIDAQPPW
jgi:hypothetical protein